MRHRADYRQLATVLGYLALVMGMYWVPAWRSVFGICVTCGLSFLTAIVNHNHLHRGLFRSRKANDWFRFALSFAALYPVSANVPAHNVVNHSFEAAGEPDWADPAQLQFRWNLLNLLHFPNVAGPVTFRGVSRWMAEAAGPELRRQYLRESIAAFGLTALLLAHDFWAGLFCVVVPQLFGARWFLRINVLQHDGCDTASEWNHSRNFVGPCFNWLTANAGYHTVHHRHAALHWTELPRVHAVEVAPRIAPELVQPSFGRYLLRTYLLSWSRPRRPVVEVSERACQSMKSSVSSA